MVIHGAGYLKMRYPRSIFERGEMPEENAQPVAETTTPDAGAETTPATDKSKPADFEAWLSGQPDEVRQMYEAHTGGLKSALDKERARNKKRDDEAAKAEQAAKDAQLSEVERIKKQLDTIKAERDQLAERVKLQAARDALIVAAEKAKITFASAVAQQDALRFALESAEIGDDGAVSNAEDVIKAVVKDREYLVSQPTQPVSTNAANRGGSNTPVVSRESMVAWGANPRYAKTN